MPSSLPALPLPPVLTSDVPGTWAHDTMSRRVRTDILARVFRENSFHDQTIARLQALDKELQNAATTPLTLIPSDGGPDVHTWNHTILSDLVTANATWLSAPWAVAEFYLYRRLMTAIDYFRTPSDPFQLQKNLGLTTAIDSICDLSLRVNSAIAATSATNALPAQSLVHLQTFVLTSLWGNRVDLSLWPVGGGNDITMNATGSTGTGTTRPSEHQSPMLHVGDKMILANHIHRLTEYVSRARARRIDIVVDNAGFELFCDLCLADFLVCAGMADTVHIQLKAHPTFVSDAMAKDVHATVKFLRQVREEGGNRSGASVLGERWAGHISSGKWLLREHFFWVQPQPMWEMPDALRRDMNTSALTFVKGDANYRRLLGDRDWPLHTPFEDILCYFPSPVCALRTLKAELGCGMEKQQTERAASEDSKWLVAGKYGVVQFCDTTNL